MFSFGITMWEILTGEEPYANMHCGAIIGMLFFFIQLGDMPITNYCRGGIMGRSGSLVSGSKWVIYGTNQNGWGRPKIFFVKNAELIQVKCQ